MSAVRLPAVEAQLRIHEADAGLGAPSASDLPTGVGTGTIQSELRVIYYHNGHGDIYLQLRYNGLPTNLLMTK